MKTLLALAFLALILAACSPAAQQPQVAPTVSNPTPPQAVAPTAPPQEGDPLASLPSDIRTLIQEVNTKTADGFSYVYTVYEGPKLVTDAASQAHVYERGNMAKLVLPVSSTYNAQTVVNELIMNYDAQSVQGYCNINKDVCGETMPSQRTASFATYVFPRPLSWLANAKDLQNQGTGQSIDGHQTVQISGTVAGVATSMWLDRYSGVPLKIQQGDKIYNYGLFSLGVSDAEMQP